MLDTLEERKEMILFRFTKALPADNHGFRHPLLLFQEHEQLCSVVFSESIPSSLEVVDES